MRRWVGLSVINVVFSMLAGVSYSYDSYDLNDVIDCIQQNLCLLAKSMVLNMIPILWYLPNVKKRFKFDIILENVRKKRELFRKLVEQHKATLDPLNPRDLIDNYLIKMTDAKNNNDTSPGSEYYTGVIFAEGNPWKEMRKFTTQSLHKMIDRHKMESSIQEEALRLATKMGEMKVVLLGISFDSFDSLYLFFLAGFLLQRTLVRWE
ncbi:PREDICTED: cytochrome P450 2B19-like [Priapulus caudatus]|uniref:Cytochrome P450 2B19-like n=1 Tax=Priapulus caudatus TaxID=37621 RepID=A0ABM1EMH1_PRICU|nr:PREDICTED: cytochrome P450 2B19-like [Priapulus caudatus]